MGKLDSSPGVSPLQAPAKPLEQSCWDWCESRGRYKIVECDGSVLGEN